MKTCRSKSVLGVLFLVLMVFLFPAASFAQGQSVFGPKDFRIGQWHFHLSVHSFSVDARGEGLILVTKKTPEKRMEGGFVLLNGQLIGLHDFLKGNNQSTERKVSLRSRNFLTVLLRGTPGATTSIEVKKGVSTPAPQVTFQAAPQAITLGESSTLQWTTTYADRIAIDQSIGDVAASGSLTVSPKDTTTYTLTATGEGGKTTASTTVGVTVPPATVSLTVNPDTIIKGGSATLTWSSTFADTVSIQPGIGTVSASGFLTVSPAQTTTYTISATGPGGTASAGATLTVFYPPTVNLEASPQTLIAGSSSTLSWNSTNAITATIEPGIGTVSPAGSVAVNPQQTTSYLITVTGPGGSASASVTVTVHQPPTVTLTANPQTVILGAGSTLSWRSTHADTATIDPGIGNVSPNGSVQIAPQTTTTYTITVNGPGGSSTSSVTVTVLYPPEVQLSAEPQKILVGAPVTLSWSSMHAETATIEPGIGSVDLNGSIEVSPGETTFYVIMVAGPGGTSQSSALVTVLYPPTVQVSANPETILKGEFSTLTWTSNHAETAIIEPGIATVGISGSLSLNPPESTTYTITATGPGGSASASITINVEDPFAPPTVSISANPAMIPKGSSSMLSWISKNAQQIHIDNGVGTVSPEGASEVSPEHTTTFTITGIGSTGVANAQVTVMVTGNPGPQPQGSFGARYEDLIPPDATLEKYEPRRFCLVTGLVQDKQGSPLTGVSVAILHHPEYGTALTDDEGRFSIPVEGGGIVTLVYQRKGFLTAQRKVNAPWNDTIAAETLKMIAQDEAATAVSFNGNPEAVTIHQSTPVSDSFGSRSCTMVFKGDNKAYAIDEDGNDIGELNTITVRATEFATPDSMPAILPPTSAYTYCVELQVDGVQRARFKDPVVVWVNNFLGFKVGSIVPAGYYDQDRGVWVPASNGIVVRLVDSDGDGRVDTVDKNGEGTTLEPLTDLGDPNIFPPGATFWRIEISHFTPWDFNWPCGPPADSISPNPSGTATASQKLEEQKDCQAQVGSYIEERSGVLHEDIPIPGTGMTLHYMSSNASGYKTLISVPASGATVPASLKRIVVRLSLAGREFEKVLPPEPFQKAEFFWDRMDHLGRRVDAPVRAQVKIGFVYDGYYLDARNMPRAFAQAGLGNLGILVREDFIRWKEDSLLIQGRRTEKDSIAEGWTLSSHHSMSPENRSLLYKGDGSLLQGNVQIVETVAGNGETGYAGDGGPATEAKLSYPYHVAVDAQGNLYITEYYNHRIRKVDADGIITTFAGTGVAGWTGDGGPAIEARLRYPWASAADNEGNLYISDFDNCCIRKVDTHGVITTIANQGACGYWGDGGPAVSAGIRDPMGIAVDGEKNIFFADGDRIRKIDTAGIITTIAGTGGEDFSGDGGPALQATFYWPFGLAVDNEGNVYVSDTFNKRVRKIDTSGIINTVAGSGKWDYSGDGGPATQAGLSETYGIAVDPSGNIYVSEYNFRIRKINTDGIITTFAGNGDDVSSGDGGPAVLASFSEPLGIAVDRAGNLYIADPWADRVRRVSASSPIAKMLAGDDILFAEESGIGHIMAGSGLHKTSIDLDTGVALFEFHYDMNKNLIYFTDQFGNATMIKRDGSGPPYEIVSPDGLVTSLTIDSNNHLTQITYPDGSLYGFEYTEDALLTAKVEPEGNRFAHEFDETGRLTDAFDENGGHWSFQRSADQQGEVHVSTETAEGAITSYLDRTKSTGAYTSVITDSFGTLTSYDQSFDGLTVTKILSCGVDSSFEYDLDPVYGFRYVPEMTERTPAGLLKVTLKERNYQDTDADMVPDLITENTTINGKTTLLQHDVLQAQKTVISPQGRSITSFYNPDSLLTTSLSVPGLYETIFDYDERGRLTSFLTNTRETTFTYDSRGFLDSVTDPENRTTSYTHDPVGRLKSLNRPDGSSLAFSYDKNGKMTVLTNPATVDHAFDYNTVNLNSSYETPLSGVYQYLYDRDRRLKQITFPSGATIKNQYDRERLMQIQTPEGNIDFTYLCGTKVGSITKGAEKVSYAYDGGLLLSETLTGTLSKTLSYVYDNDFNLKSFSYAGSATSYAYDNDGLLTGAGSLAIMRDAQNGLPINLSGGSFSLKRSFNGYGEVSGQNVSVSGTPMNTWNLIRNDNGRIIEKTEVIGGTTISYVYQYDVMGRLVQVIKDGVVTEQYQYDPRGTGTRLYELNTLRGISGRALSYSDEDLLLTAGTKTYQYSPDGFLMSRTEGASVTSYTYSSRGELLRVVLPDGNVIEYVCDPLGRRIAKKVNGAILEKYFWQGMTRLLAVYDASDNLLMRFEYADDRVPMAMTRAGEVYYLAYDQVGSLRVVADSAGTIAKRIDYDSFGNIIEDTNPGFNLPFGFAGGLHDIETGLVRFGFRDYDPDIGRWTAKDPIFFAAGDSDLYGYCLNDPVSLSDESGMIVPAIAGAIMGGTYLATVYGPYLYYRAAPYAAPIASYVARVGTSAWAYSLGFYYQYAPVIGNWAVRIGYDFWGTGQPGIKDAFVGAMKQIKDTIIKNPPPPLEPFIEEEDPQPDACFFGQ